MKIKPFEIVLALLSLPIFCFSSVISISSVLAESTLAKQETMIAQLFPNWSRVRINKLFSVMFPGSWNYTDNGIESVFDETYYLVAQESFEGEVPELNGGNVCDFMNCKTVLALATQEFANEGNLVLKDMRPISITLQNYPIDGIEFIANHPNEPMQMKGRMLIVGNNLYLLAAGTSNSYFDNNVKIFLESFSF